MPTQSSPSGYSIYDLLTRVVPGITVLIPFIVAYLITETQVKVELNVALVALAGVGLVIGEVINLIRSSIVHVPVPFKQVIYHHTGDESILGRGDRLDLWAKNKLPARYQSRFFTDDVGRSTIFDSEEIDFQTSFEDHFGLDFEEDSAYSIYQTFLSYMDGRMATQTRRNYILRIFAQNLMFASGLTVLTTLWVIYKNLDQPQLLLGAIISVSILTILFQVAMLFSSAAYKLVDLLIIDYYVDQL